MPNELLLGINTLAFTSPFSDQDVELFPRLKQMGYEAIEITFEEPGAFDTALARSAASDSGLALLLSGAFGEERDVSHEDPEVRRTAVDFIKQGIDVAAELGSPYLAGPMYSAVGKARPLSRAGRTQQWRWAVESLHDAALYAQAQHIRLAIEPLNRYETDMINTVDQGLQLCKDIGLESAGLMLDTYHMNIEEKNIPQAIRAAGSKIVNFQASENDRGTPGTGHVPWQEVILALRELNYTGAIVIESFIPTVKSIARAVSLWRPVATSMDDLAREGAHFLLELMNESVLEDRASGPASRDFTNLR
jgi:D-psicose/D-tagatose/L-ribulose 3-epimerase